MIKVIIADDQPKIRQGLKLILADQTDFEVTGEADTEAETMQQLQACVCDILILDLSMAGRQGINFIKQIKAIKPTLPILIFSMHQERQYAVSSLQAGASGYLSKNTDPKEIIAAIRKLVVESLPLPAPVNQEPPIN